MKEFIAILKTKEPEMVKLVMAFMSYNPSIGRVLQKKGVKSFQQMVLRKSEQLLKIHTIQEFDKFHGRWIEQFIKKIRNNKGKKCTVGQAQKAINVFLKIYVDWARLPDRKTANRLLPFLHVPLDSILMESIKDKIPDFYKNKIEVLREHNSTHSLSKIGRQEYDEWQKFFRESYRRKPILFDIIWAINR